MDFSYFIFLNICTLFSKNQIVLTKKTTTTICFDYFRQFVEFAMKSKLEIEKSMQQQFGAIFSRVALTGPK